MSNSELTKIVCVVNDYAVFDEVVKSNEHLRGCEIFDFDNTKENIFIPVRYNDFIEHHIDDKSDFWVMFIHQDFGLMENTEFLDKLDPQNIYGAIGAKLYNGIFWGKRPLTGDFGFKRTLKLIKGQILQGNGDLNFRKYGLKIFNQTDVDALDCCCIIVHSSLISKYQLRFDENLGFHLYAEEFCYSAKLNHKIKSKVVPFKCYHLGKGNIDEEFERSALYLKEKFKIPQIPSTCPN